MRKIKYYILSILSLLLAVSCSQDLEYEDSSVNGVLSFDVQALPYQGKETRTVTNVAEPIKFTRLDYYIFDEQNKLVTGIRSLYDADLQQIKAEGLRDGNYHLLILAVKGDHRADGATINSISEMNDTWISFDNTAIENPLKAEYYYINHLFRVSGNKLINPTIRMPRMVGLVDFQFLYANDYVRASIESIVLEFTPDQFSYRNMKCNGTYSDARQTPKTLSVMTNNTMLLLPHADGGALTGSLIITSLRHTGERFVQRYNFSTIVKPNEHSVVRVAVKLVDDQTGTIYGSRKSYLPSNFYYILTDNEPKSIYYDSRQRSFKVNAPLQVEFNAAKQLHTRFYSAVPIANVTLMAKIDDIDEYFEFAYFDTIPAFSDITYSTPLTSRKATYRTESGNYIEINPRADLTSDQISFKIVSNDIYWQKIQEIKAQWLISFASYGGDPDAANGAPAGNWMGIRPVHIRESVALLTNMAWFNERPEYRAKLIREQGQYYTWWGENIPEHRTYLPDNTILIEQMRNRPSIVVGLVWPGNGVVGLGGGSTWGMAQNRFLDHYLDRGSNTGTAFHESGHCMGYSHQSTMSYGAWAVDASSVYRELQPQLPVNSSQYLKSYMSAYKY